MMKIEKRLDDRTVEWGDRIVGAFGPCSSVVLLGWLAKHRGRLRILLFGGTKLSVLIIWDREGTKPHGS